MGAVLTSLDVSHNRLGEIDGQLPPLISTLTRLEIANFSHNKLSRLPEELFRLTQVLPLPSLSPLFSSTHFALI